jgi:hypothetical protein
LDTLQTNPDKSAQERSTAGNVELGPAIRHIAVTNRTAPGIVHKDQQIRHVTRSLACPIYRRAMKEDNIKPKR